MSRYAACLSLFLSVGCAGDPSARNGAGSPEAKADSVEMVAAHDDDEARTDAGSEEPADAGSSARAGPNGDAEAAELAPAVDPAVAHALLSKTGEGAGSAPLGLRFEVVELGSELPWGFAVVNRGTEAATVDFDARLLSLEVTPPELASDATRKPKIKNKPKTKPPKPVVCRLPLDIAPNSVDPALAVGLEPGQGIVQVFDPRLYCIGKAPWPLVEGATVSPRLGWPEAMKVSFRGGKREEKPGVQREPFVAEPSPASGSLPANEAADSGERRVKQLVATPFTLGAGFALVDSEVSRPPAPPGLELSITGGDANNEGSAVVTSTIVNRGRRKQDLYFRREFVSYEVAGPDGVFQCDPKPDNRAPADRSAVTTLSPGARLSAVSRLIELCPAHAFARPGLYLVHGRFDSADSGAALGFRAFMGRIVTQKPALVRIRQGELPFTPLSNAVRVHVGE